MGGGPARGGGCSAAIRPAAGSSGCAPRVWLSPAPRPYIPPAARMANEMQMSSPPIWRELSQRSHFSKPSAQWIAKWSVSCKMCNPPPRPHSSPPLALPQRPPPAPPSSLSTQNALIYIPAKCSPQESPLLPTLVPPPPPAPSQATGSRRPTGTRGRRGASRPRSAAGLVRWTRSGRLSRPRRPPTVFSRPCPGASGAAGGEVRGPGPVSRLLPGSLFLKSLRGWGPMGSGQARAVGRVAGAQRQFREVWEGLTPTHPRRGRRLCV